MANSYKRVYIHLVFAVKGRKSLLEKSWRSKVFSYLSGALKERGHYPLACNGYYDHVHLLFDYNCKELISDLVREIKKSSSAYIKENRFCPYKFEWQGGYGVFSVGWREKKGIMKYIMNQEEHHSKKATFENEYLSLLDEYKIEFRNKYLFEFIDI